MKTQLKTTLRTIALAVAAVAILTGGLAGCTLFGRSGVVTLNLTDAPVDAENVKGVYISITKVEVNNNDDWVEFASYDPAKTVNLLELQGGETALPM